MCAELIIKEPWYILHSRIMFLPYIHRTIAIASYNHTVMGALHSTQPNATYRIRYANIMLQITKIGC